MSPSNTDKTTELIQRLTRRTNESKIRWKAEAEDGTAFSVSLEHGNVVIVSGDGDGLPPTRVEIYNREGILVTTVESEDGSLNPRANPIYGLWIAVRDSAGPAGPVLDGLLEDLGDDFPF